MSDPIVERDQAAGLLAEVARAAGASADVDAILPITRALGAPLLHAPVVGTSG